MTAGAGAEEAGAAAGRRRREKAPDALRLDALEKTARAAFRQAGVLNVVSGLLWPVQAWVIAAQIAGWLEGRASVAAALISAAAFFLLAVLRALLDHRAGAVVYAAADRLVADARAAILARESLRATGGPASAEVGALVAQKLPMLIPYLTRYRPAQFRAGVLPLVLLALTFWHSWAAGLVLLVAGPLIPVFMALIGIAAKEASQKQMAEIGDLNSLLMDRLGALVDIRLLDAGERTARDFEARADGLRARTMGVLRIAFLSSAVLELFSAIGMAMVAVYVGFSLLGTVQFGTWAGHLSAGEGIFLLLLAPEYFMPLRDLSAAWHDRAAALAVAGELAAIEAEPATQALGAGAAGAPLAGAATVALRGGVVARGNRMVALPDLALAPGDRVALTGASGAGKSTLLAVLAGLVPLTAGELTVAGVPLTAETADGWRARLAWVGQAPHFLDQPLAQNLDLRGTGADLVPALAAARAEAVVAALPGGLQARLGETGGGISGGEARRLMLARAFAARPEVLLADEPTADLDRETADAIIAALMDLGAQGATLVVATHDPALVAALGREVRL